MTCWRKRGRNTRRALKFLPRWETSAVDLAAAYAQRMSQVGRKGYGMFAKYHVFTVENGQLVPVKYPTPSGWRSCPAMSGSGKSK